MNFYSHCESGFPSTPSGHLRGMTVIETLLAVGVFAIVILGLLASNLLGLKEDQLIESKGGASQTSREAINTLLTDIRTAKGYYLGTYSGSAFTPFTNGAMQQGGAVLIYPVVNSTNGAVDTSQIIVYYYDSSDSANSDGCLLRYASNSVSVTSTVIASNLIAPLYFTGEDYTGATQYDRTFKGVIHTTLQFCQFQYPTTTVGSNCLFSSYHIDCRATPHLPDGP